MPTANPRFFILVSALMGAVGIMAFKHQQTGDEAYHAPGKMTTPEHIPLHDISDNRVATQKMPDSPEEDTEAEHNAIASRFDTRVRFWGKVVDQDNGPLEGVNITATVTTLRLIKYANGYREYEILKTKSSSDGTFMFDGTEGMYLDIDALEKEGYVLPSAYQFGMSHVIGAKYHYRYSSIGNQEQVFSPNHDRPEVFHLWKLNNPEPLVISGNYPGRSGPEFVVGGQPTLFRTISMMVTNIGTAQTPQWEVTVSSLEADGGIIETDPADVFMFKAPESGYMHSIKFRYGREGTDADQDDPGVQFRFFVRSNGGSRHAACEFTFFAPNMNGVVETKMRSWTNPNGSRNLEHDAAHPLPEPSLKR